jgi:hypothetical protein
MGEENHDRQLRRARARYVGAKDRFLAALAAFDDSGTPMDPGPDLEPYPWTGEQRTTSRISFGAAGDGRRPAHVGRDAAGVAGTLVAFSGHADRP